MFCIFWGGFDTSLIQRVDAGKRCPPMTGIEEIEANYTMCFIKLVYGVYIKILSLQTCSTLTACDSLVVFYLAKFHFITPNICQYWSVPEKPVVGLWILLIPKKKRSNDLLGLSSFMQYVLPLNVSLRRYPNHSHGFLGTIKKYY